MPTTNKTETQPPRTGGGGITKVCISAPASADLAVLKNALQRKGIEYFYVDQLSMTGQTVSEALRNSIAAADLIIGILVPDMNNNNVFLELGLAIGMQKRLLLFAPSEEVLPGVLLTGVPVVRALSGDAEKIEFGLNQVLSAPKKRDSSKPPTKQMHPLGNKADEYLAALRKEGQKSPLAFEEIVWEAILASGVNSFSGSPKTDSPLVVWSDDFEPWISNPLIIEIKQGNIPTHVVDQFAGQMQRHLHDRGAMWGMLVHGGSTTTAAEKAGAAFNVLSISAEELLTALKTEAFGDVVQRLRNRRVHGVV